MLEHVIPVLISIISWPSILYLVLGAMLGLLFGVLPGLGGPQVLALLLPVTFTMEPNQAITMLMGAAGAVAFGGSLSAILINTPGTPQNAATIFDGFPLTREGKSGMAIGAAATASVMGAIFGAIILTLILPIGRNIVLAFSYPEYFMLAILGLSMIVTLSQGSMWKAIIAGGIGLMLSFVGFDPVTGAVRYTFGIDYLWDGIQLIPVLIGLFAISESISLFMKKGAIASGKVNASRQGIAEGAKSVFQHFGLFIRSSVIGTIIGIIPGVGGSVANFLAYGQAVSTSKNKQNFGKGDIRGVIAPESSNNAKDGGALVPTLIFGIPGGLEMAVLLGALTIHGIQPGPRLMLDNPDIAVTLIYTLVLANFIVGAVGILLAGPLTKLTALKTTYVAPLIMMIALIGAYATNNYIGDVIVALTFGLVGYAMRRYDFSRIALVIALVLGGMIQQSFHQTLDFIGMSGFFVRPISLLLFLITVLMLILPALKKFKRGEVS